MGQGSDLGPSLPFISFKILPLSIPLSINTPVNTFNYDKQDRQGKAASNERS
jgi:hypothetical protein